MTIRQAQQIFFRPEFQCLNLQYHGLPILIRRRGRDPGLARTASQPGTIRRAASGVIGLEELLEDLLSTQTQDGARLTLLLSWRRSGDKGTNRTANLWRLGSKYGRVQNNPRQRLARSRLMFGLAWCPARHSLYLIWSVQKRSSRTSDWLSFVNSPGLIPPICSTVATCLS